MTLEIRIMCADNDNDTCADNCSKSLSSSRSRRRRSQPQQRTATQRRSLLVDYSKFSCPQISSNDDCVKPMSSSGSTRSLYTATTLTRRSTSGSIKTRARRGEETRRPSMPSFFATASQQQQQQQQQQHLRSNRQRLLQVLDKVTTELKPVDEGSAASSSAEITFCLKKRNSHSDLLGDMNMNMGHTMDDSSDKSAASSNSNSNSHDHLLLDRSTAHSRRDTLRKTLKSRSLRDLNLNTAPLTVFPRKAAMRAQNKKLEDDKHPSHNHNNTNSAALDDSSMHNGMTNISLQKAPNANRRSRSSRGILTNMLMDDSENTTPLSPIGMGTGSGREFKVDRRVLVRPSSTLLPRQRSLKDLMASKQKAKSRLVNTLVKQGSFTTKQSEFAALEALIGKKPTLATAATTISTTTTTTTNYMATMAPPSLTRSHSCGATITTANVTHKNKSSTKTSQVAVPTKIAVTHSPMTRHSSSSSSSRHYSTRSPPPPSSMRRVPSPTSSGSATTTNNNHGFMTPAQRRRMMLLQNGASTTHKSASGVTTPQRSNSFGSASAALSANSLHSAGELHRRGQMLRQGSFVAGSRMRTLN